MKKLARIIGIFIFLCTFFTPTVHAQGLFGCTIITSDTDIQNCRNAKKTVCSQAVSWCCEKPAQCFAGTNTAASVCDVVQDGGQKSACQSCMNNGQGSWTAIGCIETDPSKFIAKFLGLGIGMAGGIAFLLILFAGFQMMTSAGNPEALTAAKELMGSAIAGLLLIIFSVFLLRIIGVSILGIPGFQ